MGSRPAVKTRPLARDKLASFLGNHELIKAFENITSDVSEALPAAISELTSSGVLLASDVSESAGLFVDAPGMAFALDASAAYIIDGMFGFQSDATLPSIGLGFALPLGSTITGRYGYAIDTTPLTDPAASPDASVATGALTIITGRWLIETGAETGNAQLRFKSMIPGYRVTLAASRCTLIANRIA